MDTRALHSLRPWSPPGDEKVETKLPLGSRKPVPALGETLYVTSLLDTSNSCKTAMPTPESCAAPHESDCGPLQLLRGKPGRGVPLSELEEGYATEEMDESGDAESKRVVVLNPR